MHLLCFQALVRRSEVHRRTEHLLWKETFCLLLWFFSYNAEKSFSYYDLADILPSELKHAWLLQMSSLNREGYLFKYFLHLIFFIFPLNFFDRVESFYYPFSRVSCSSLIVLPQISDLYSNLIYSLQVFSCFPFLILKKICFLIIMNFERILIYLKYENTSIKT